VQAEQERFLYVWPTCFEEERGVEALVEYMYMDHKSIEKSFVLSLLLRLSESTDIVGVAMNCMQSLASLYKLISDTAMGELTLLADLQDVSHSHAPPWIGIQEWHGEITQMCRPDPLCCRAKGIPCANNVVTPELSHVFPEEVIFFDFECYTLVPEYSMRNSSAPVTRNVRLPLQLEVFLAPHLVDVERMQASYVFEIIRDNDEECIVVDIQQVRKMVRSRPINCFLCQPKVTKYAIGWATKHGILCCSPFVVPNYRSFCPF
jgi:hypothetical protein